MPKENNGWISLHRKLLDNPIMAKPFYLSVWIYLLLSANHEDADLIWNNEKIVIKRGQFIGSLRQISKHFKISLSTVHNICTYLISERMIEQSSNKKFTLFTIINYCKYQDVEHKSEHKVNTRRTQGETNNNDNKKNNITVPVLQGGEVAPETSSGKERFEQNLPLIEKTLLTNSKFLPYNDKHLHAEIEVAADWIRSKGYYTKYKDWGAFFRNWLRRAIDEGKIKEKENNLTGYVR